MRGESSMNNPMDNEANSEIVLRYFCVIRQIGWNWLDNKLALPAYFQLN